jgi:Tfp pilus assembly protein PilV
MLKTISAALLAVSVLAAPALAAGQATQKATKTAQTPAIKAEQMKAKPGALKANARMSRHHVRHASRDRFHKHFGSLKSHKVSKVSTKHVTSATKRG